MAKASPLASVAATREVLERHGAWTKHGLGQNFLVNDDVVRRILELSAVGPDDVVLEVGPGREYIAQKNAFLCATPNVVLSAHVTGAKSGFFGGEGFVLQRYSGQGMAFLELDGTIVEKELAPGEKIKVDTGNIAFFEAGVGYSSEMVKGFANILFGGEGLFLSTLTGPGKVWLQTMSVSELAKRIIPFIPSGK